MSIRKFIICFFASSAVLAQEEPIAISIDELPAMLDANSPYASIIEEQYNLSTAESDLALQWSNPELNYTREYVENNAADETEQLIYLSKKFSMPWNYWQMKNARDAEINAAGMQKEQNSRDLLANARTAYAHLALLNNQLRRTQSLKQMLSDLNLVVQSRNQEGAISKLDASLLSMLVFTLEADLLRIRKQNKQALSHIRQLLGIRESSEIKLTTPIVYKDVLLDLNIEMVSIDGNAGLKAGLLKSDALKSRVSLEKGNILPDLTLYGGYKTINEDWKGYTLGISLPLPVLNFNRPQIRKQEAKKNIRDKENILYRQRLQSNAEILLEAINDTKKLLSKHDEEVYNPVVMENLKSAYNEGAVTLTELINSANIYRESYRQYTEQLDSYYQAIFEFEALSGRQLITF